MTANYLNNYMKPRFKFKAGKKTLFALSIVGMAVGLSIIITVLIGYVELSSNGFYYGGVKLGGSLLSHQMIYDIYIISAAGILSVSSIFLFLRLAFQKRRK